MDGRWVTSDTNTKPPIKTFYYDTIHYSIIKFLIKWLIIRLEEKVVLNVNYTSFKECQRCEQQYSHRLSVVAN